MTPLPLRLRLRILLGWELLSLLRVELHPDGGYTAFTTEVWLIPPRWAYRRGQERVLAWSWTTKMFPPQRERPPLHPIRGRR